MKKRLLALILTLVMCLALVPTAALAAEEFEVEDGVLTKYTGPGGAVTIPDGVTSIGMNAFSGCTGLTSVTIPDSVTEIGDGAFLDCRGLTSVTIPSSVTSIGSFAFGGCTGLISVYIPNNVTYIGVDTFVNCAVLTTIQVDTGNPNYTSENGVLFTKDKNALVAYPGGKQGAYTIPDSVTVIAAGAFWNCTGLTSVAIPDCVTRIGFAAFSGCTGLTDIQLEKGNQNYTVVDGVLFTKDGKILYIYPGGKQGAYTIPSSVTSIGIYAFANCTSLTSVTIPDSVTYIESNAFSGCMGLTGVTIPNSVTSIGNDAFRGCTSLTSVAIPNSVTSFGQWAFADCTGLTSVTIPNSVSSIGIYAFANCTSLTSVTIPDSVTYIESNAFSGCMGLTGVTIPNSVTSIWKDAFDCTGLKDVYYGGTQEQWEAISINLGNDPLTSATIHFNSTGPTAQPTNDKLSVDGAAKSPAAYKIGGANYFKLRDVAMLLNGTNAQFEISYDNDKKAINITTGRPYTPQGYELQAMPAGSAGAETSNDAVYIDGNKVELTAYKIGGANFYGIRDLGRALGFNVGWKQGTGMYIESNKPYSDAD